MRAVVTQIQGNFAAILSEDGRIEKITNKNYVIGQVIEMKEHVKIKKHIAAWVASAAAIVLVALGGTAYAYYSPYYYVSLDVNPSIEYTINRFDRVLTAKAVNEDGTEILKEVELKNLSNRTIDDAISLTVAQIKEDGYFGDNDGDIVIATSGADLKKAEKLANRLKENAENVAGDEVTVEANHVGRDRVEEARKLGTTPGKLNLVQKLQESASDPTAINTEEWLNKPVKDIMKEIKANRKDSTDDKQDDKTETDNDVTSSDIASSDLTNSNTDSEATNESPDESAPQVESNTSSELSSDKNASKTNGKKTTQQNKNGNKEN